MKPRTESDDSGFVSADKTIDTLGDGTVIAISAITPGFKCADEFNKRVPGYKPVSFVEHCGSYNTKMDIRKPGEQENDQLFGIPCICNPGSESTCDHVGMVGEAGMVDFIIHNIFSQSRS